MLDGAAGADSLSLSLSLARAQEPERKRTKAEIMEEVMAKSKAYKVGSHFGEEASNGPNPCRNPVRATKGQVGRR